MGWPVCAITWPGGRLSLLAPRRAYSLCPYFRAGAIAATDVLSALTSAKNAANVSFAELDEWIRPGADGRT